MEELGEITSKPVRFAPARRCIYCNATEGKLTDEHIIPYGLAGNALILPEASCHACQDVTSQIESGVLQHQLIQLRTALKVPTRKPKKRPTEFELYQAFYEDGAAQASHSESRLVRAEDFPWRFMALLMDEAGFLLGFPRFQPLPWEIWSTGQSLPALLPTEKRTVATRVGAINPYTFARFLAKVAHGYAAAHHGQAFEPMLLDLINGTTDASFRYWIGGDGKAQPPQPGKLHHVSLQKVQRGGTTYLVCVIHLFRFLGTPVYHAVVGRLKETGA